MEKDIRQLVEDYKNYTRSEFKVQKTLRDPNTNLNKSYLE